MPMVFLASGQIGTPYKKVVGAVARLIVWCSGVLSQVPFTSM